MWILYSFLGAFFQASEMAVKKKALQTKGLNNTIAFLAFIFAGILLGALLYVQSGKIWPENSLSGNFWEGMIVVIVLNVLAVYFLYKALDIADLSYLMPFMTLTSLFLVIPPIFVLGEIPSVIGFAGIAITVTGAFLMDYKKKTGIIAFEEYDKKIKNRKGLFYFLITALCFTITPTAIKVAIAESSALFASFLSHILIGISFIILIFIFKETKRIKEIFAFGGTGKFFFAVALAGIFIAIANGSVNEALKMTDVSYVFAIKRTMPFFAFIIGYFYFKERQDVFKKILATILMVLGAIIITVFK